MKRCLSLVVYLVLISHIRALYATPEISVEQPTGTELTDGASTVAFGNASVQAFGTNRSFRIRNTGTATLSGIAVSIDGADAGMFSVFGTAPETSLAAGGETTFTLRFLPTSLGTKSAALHIASNDADENPFDIAMSGTGVDATGPQGGTFTISPASPFVPYSPGVELTATFAGWTDISLPLSYTVAMGNVGTISPQGSSTVRTFNLPGEPGIYWIIGSIFDSLGNSNQRGVVVGVKPVRSWAVLAGSGYADGTGADARFNHPYDVAADANGNLYVADAEGGMVRRISSTGVVTTVAGAFLQGDNRDGVRGAARFDNPLGIAVDGFGNVYVAANQLRKISPAGVVTTLAAETLQGCVSAAVDGAGNIYVASSDLIQKVTPAGVASIFAGNPLSPGSADGTGMAASFYSPEGVAVDTTGNVYVADYANHTIRKITPAGVVTTLAGSAGQVGFTDGTGAAARFSNPQGVAVDAAGNVYVADYSNNAVRKVTPAGVVTTLADASDNLGSSLTGITVDLSGNVFVADESERTIRKVTPAGNVSVFAGTFGEQITDGSGSEDGLPSRAMFDNPRGVACDASGNSYVVDAANCTIRKVTSAGVVSTFAGSPGQFGSADGTGSAARFSGEASGIAINTAGELFVADYETVRKITPAGVVTTLAGMAGVGGGSVDGTGSAARFSGLRGIAVGATGDIYAVDLGNGTIRKITSAGVVTTLAGLAGATGTADGTGSAARFNEPVGIAVDANGDLLVTDVGNHTIRKVTPSGVVTTIAGVAGVSGSTDGPIASARFDRPTEIAVASDGTIYASQDGRRLRRISTTGYVSTISSSYAESTGLFGQELDLTYTEGIAARSDGALIVTDWQNHRIVVGNLLSSNANLSTLAPSAGTLSPAFASGTTAYTATVPQATASITFTPALAQAGATVTVNGYAGNSGSASRAFPLSIGSNLFSIVVTSEDISEVKTYTVDVTRASAPPTPQELFDSAMAAAGLTGPAAQADAVPFGDGVANLLKYAFNMNLAAADSTTLVPGTSTAGLPAVGAQGSPGARMLRFEFLRAIGKGLHYSPMKSMELTPGTWLPFSSTPTVNAVNASWERVVHLEPAADARTFARVHVGFEPWDGFEWAAVGEPGNTADPATGYGAVAQSFRISKYEISIAQYAEFLNAVATVADPHLLFHPFMATDANVAGIQRSGAPGAYTYQAIGTGSRPVGYISWMDAARFVNWLHNGRGNGSTESGVYDLSLPPENITRSVNAAYFLPSENEWYKGAYHQPGGTWFLYPTVANTVPLNDVTTAPGAANFKAADYTTTPGNGVYSATTPYLTPVGAFPGSASPWGVFDLGGGMWEWTEGQSGIQRVRRGGSWGDGEIHLRSTDRTLRNTDEENSTTGFRIAKP
ncbi:MAG: SUMF1/EgtB/PvdO family nonheme iron enzyme [Verrucomicrobiaceae bacterium]|nr:SUMF1/EgtB/PvdO family nonheme iron enzyme [Verrucomicrobiaceae bacterium]